MPDEDEELKHLDELFQPEQAQENSVPETDEPLGDILPEVHRIPDKVPELKEDEESIDALFSEIEHPKPELLEDQTKLIEDHSKPT